jgi:hypothetical protein
MEAIQGNAARGYMTEEELIQAIEERANRLGVKVDLRIG